MPDHAKRLPQTGRLLFFIDGTPSRALVHESIYERFMDRAIARVEKICQGHPLESSTMIGAQASNDQMEKILSYIDIGRQEGANVLTGGTRNVLDGEAAEGYYVKPTTCTKSSPRRRTSSASPRGVMPTITRHILGGTRTSWR